MKTPAEALVMQRPTQIEPPAPVQVSWTGAALEGEDAAHVQLLEAALKEVLACPPGTGPRAYAAALMKVADDVQ